MLYLATEAAYRDIRDMRDYVAYSIGQVDEGRIDVDRNDISLFRRQLRLTSSHPSRRFLRRSGGQRLSRFGGIPASRVALASCVRQRA